MKDNVSTEIVQTGSKTYKVEEVPIEDAYANVCGMTKIEGARTEREALCSGAGLKLTRRNPPSSRLPKA
ncbi:uncharacterized protein L203_105352 [Cryptococcus depauperatus CBS 7841]|uniref:Uncharacterized protein n=1 Tax=Cryptococcus depauperatus CBS 7841 TaxID=1295531 RepID=A0A1E3HLQ7_9TREE|nr:hypothetical protein L203_06352 [Cryptococcus depauperatus CBS 7841]